MLQVALFAGIGAVLVLVLHLSDGVLRRIMRLFVPERGEQEPAGTHQLPPTPNFH